MERIKKILKKCFVLPPFVAVIICVFSFALVFSVLAKGEERTALAYASYILSSYAAAVLCSTLPSAVKRVKNGFGDIGAVKKIKSTRMGKEFVESGIFRSAVSLHQGFAFNLIYATAKMLLGILYKSVWLISFGLYYLLLAVMRGVLIQYVHKGKEIGVDVRAEFKRYRACGFVLLIMNQALACIVIYIVHENRGFNYPGNLIYLMALYVFYAVITAVVNVRRFRKHGSPILSAAKAVSLTAALVSMLSLETAMLNQFGTEDESFRKIMTGISGGAVCTFVLIMAIYMVVRSSKYLKTSIEKENCNEK
jgi:hypothetical protein